MSALMNAWALSLSPGRLAWATPLFPNLVYKQLCFVHTQLTYEIDLTETTSQITDSSFLDLGKLDLEVTTWRLELRKRTKF